MLCRASRRAIVVEAARKGITTDRWLSACLSAKPRLLVSLTIPDGLGAQTFPHRPLRVFLAYSAWWWLLSDRSGGSACILPCQPFLRAVWLVHVLPARGMVRVVGEEPATQTFPPLTLFRSGWRARWAEAESEWVGGQGSIPNH